MKTKIAAIVLPLLITSCASPTVVSERQAGDESLSCSQLVLALREAEQFEEDARRDRGVTGTNVAAAVFFWPGLIGTYANTEEAIDAAADRQDYLNDLYAQKNCTSTQSTASESAAGNQDTASRLRELRTMFDEGLITQEEYDSARARALDL